MSGLVLNHVQIQYDTNCYNSYDFNSRLEMKTWRNTLKFEQMAQRKFLTTKTTKWFLGWLRAGRAIKNVFLIRNNIVILWHFILYFKLWMKMNSKVTADQRKRQISLKKFRFLYVDSGFVKPCDELVIGYSRMWQRWSIDRFWRIL